MSETPADRRAGLTPYDTGRRLEPHLWVYGREVVGSEGDRRPAEDTDFGKVDFDDDTGTSILTLYMRPDAHGYEVLLEPHIDTFVRVTGGERPPIMWGPSHELGLDYRTEQMEHLAQRLQEIAAPYTDLLRYYDDGDPFAFHPGNFVFLPHDRDGTCFAIEEAYAQASDWNDPVTYVPIGWQWYDYRLIPHPDGSRDAGLVASGTTIPSDIHALIARADDWAATKCRELEAESGLSLAPQAPAVSPPEPRQI